MKAMLDALTTGARPDLHALVDAFGDAVPSLHDLATTPQDPSWHAEGDVFTHTSMVLNEQYKALERDNIAPVVERELILGVLFHDLAKPWTTCRREIKGIERVVAPRHEAKGRSALATAMVDVPGLPWPILWSVMGLVGSHHEPKLLTVKDRAPGEYKRISRRVDLELVGILEQADMRGRICPDQKEQLEHIELFLMGAEDYAPTGWQQDWIEPFSDHLSDRPQAVRDRVFGEAIRALEAGKITTSEEADHLAFQTPDDVPELVILCGPSGSGKSTFVERSLADHEVVSLDAIREELTGRRADHSREGAVLQEARKRLKAALRPGRKVVWDATSLRLDFRAPLCATGFDYGALVTIVAFQHSAASYAQRNEQREHAIPRSAVGAQIASWEFPEPDEAHRLIVLDGSHAVRGAFGICGPPTDAFLPWGLRHA